MEILLFHLIISTRNRSGESICIRKVYRAGAKAPGFYDLRRSMSMDFFYACIQYATWVA